MDGSGFDPKYKFTLTTVDVAGVEVGQTTNINRPRRDGTFKVGINVPTAQGASKIRAYQRGVKVAEVAVTVQVVAPVTPPSAPLSLAATAGDTSVGLSWQAPSSNGGSPITLYHVYSDGTLVASPTSSPLTLLALTNGRTYTFAVAAVNAAGEGARASVTATPVGAITVPFQGFAKTEAAVSAGAVVDVPAGVYKERFTLSKPGVTWRLATGAIVDLSSFAIPIQQGGVVLKGDDIKFIGDGEITGSTGSAIVVDGNRVTVTANIHHNVEEGYVWHGSDGLMKGGSNHHNNETGQMWDSSEQGAGKANCQRLTIDGVHVYEIGRGGADPNAGQGLWYDSIGQFSNGEVKNCLIHDVFYAGIFFEISQDGKMHDNVIHHCGWTPSGNGFWGAGLLLSSSRRVEVYNNLLAYNKYNGIRVLCQNRGDRPGDTVGVSVHNNTLIGNGTGIGFDTDNATIQQTMFAADSGNVLYANRFDVPKAYWKPKGTLTTIDSINTLPGGGGNSVMTSAEVTQILAANNIVK